MAEFDLQQFLDSLLGPSKYGGYTPMNSIILWGAFFLATLIVILPILKKNNIKLDVGFSIALLPYIIFGTLIRVFTDLKLLPYTTNPLELGFYTHTPGLWIFIGTLVVVCILASKKLGGQLGWNPTKIFGGFGAILMTLALLVFFSLQLDDVALLLTILTLVALVGVTLFAAEIIFRTFTKNGLNVLGVIAHSLGSASVVILGFSGKCVSQHFVSRSVVSFSPLLFPVIKLFLVIALLHLIDKVINDEYLQKYARLLLIALGFMMGTRDVWLIATGICT